VVDGTGMDAVQCILRAHWQMGAIHASSATAAFRVAAGCAHRAAHPTGSPNFHNRAPPLKIASSIIALQTLDFTEWNQVPLKLLPLLNHARPEDRSKH